MKHRIDKVELLTENKWYRLNDFIDKLCDLRNSLSSQGICSTEAKVRVMPISNIDAVVVCEYLTERELTASEAEAELILDLARSRLTYQRMQKGLKWRQEQFEESLEQNLKMEQEIKEKERELEELTTVRQKEESKNVD